MRKPEIGDLISIWAMRVLVISTSSGGLIALAGEGGDLGFIGSRVEIDGGFLHFEFLLGDAVIDLAFLALETADDFLFGGFEAGAFDGELGVGEIGLVLLVVILDWARA